MEGSLLSLWQSFVYKTTPCTKKSNSGGVPSKLPKKSKKNHITAYIGYVYDITTKEECKNIRFIMFKE